MGHTVGNHDALEISAALKCKVIHDLNAAGNGVLSLRLSGRIGNQGILILAEQDTVLAAIGLVAAVNRDVLQTAAISEHTETDVGHTCRNRNLRQTITVCKRLIHDFRQAAGECNALNAFVREKCARSNTRHTFLKHHRSDLAAVLFPGSRARFIRPHLTLAADGQRAILGQRPGKIGAIVLSAAITAGEDLRGIAGLLVVRRLDHPAQGSTKIGRIIGIEGLIGPGGDHADACQIVDIGRVPQVAAHIGEIAVIGIVPDILRVNIAVHRAV